MIIFDSGGNKNLILVILVILFTGFIAWQWAASDPFASVDMEDNFLIKIGEDAGDSLGAVKNSLDQGKEDTKIVIDELSKQEQQDQLFEEAQKYLEAKENSDLLLSINQEDCEVEGGEWDVWGDDTEEVCNLFTTDADKECNDSSECESICIVDLPEIALKDLPIEVGGNCTARSIVPGCYSLVEEGLVYGIVCD
ncbi:MAG: hypothetical protein HOE19_01635 [Candidatus Komeilibacteria bacterium]|jgi:hypothetical protein|nr:hypothetical protein [Candidatus Komeilibacteria bacterium]MBT4447516.1 hypothetical protein [Candidatus Komeilibacteria bacterium]